MRLPAHPLAVLSRKMALLLAVITLLACVWNGFALEMRDAAHTGDIAERLERGERLDMDLYRAINGRVAAGESYYTAAATEHRVFGMPTAPFVTMRTPVLAWTTALWGADGWRIIAVLLWAANILAWYGALRRSGRSTALAAAALAAAFGMVGFIPDIAFSHELLAGMMLSLALALSAGPGWLAGLLMATCAIALRELALPFLGAWGVVACLAGERGKALAIAGALLALLVGFTVHAAMVDAVRAPGDLVSSGWSGLLGPALPLYGIHVTTLLQTLPSWLAGTLGVLALLGWLGAGGRLGMFAALWFASFITAVALFARQDNFYWMGLFVPAYGVGLALVPRALVDLAGAVRQSRVARSPTRVSQ